MNDRPVRYRPARGASVRARWARRAWSSSVVAVAGTLLMACGTATSGSGGAIVPSPSGSGVATVPAPSGTGDTQAGAPLVPAGCLLLVRALTSPTAGETAGVYTGGFLVLRVEDDGQVRGEGGDFNSEGYDVRGEIGTQGAELEANAPTDPLQWQPLPLVWLPDGETFDGWQRVSPEEMREYSGGGVPSPRSGCREEATQ